MKRIAQYGMMGTVIGAVIGAICGYFSYYDEPAPIIPQEGIMCICAGLFAPGGLFLGIMAGALVNHHTAKKPPLDSH